MDEQHDERIESQFACPNCGDHPVTVVTEGFWATTAKVSGCPQWGDWSVVVPASTPIGWLPWQERPDGLRHVDGLVIFTGTLTGW